MPRHVRNARSIPGTGHAVLLTVTIATPAAAADPSLSFFSERIDTGTLVLLSALIGALVFAVLSTIQLIRARNRAESDNRRLRLLVGDLKATADRAQALVNEEDQRLVAWGEKAAPPLVTVSQPVEESVTSYLYLTGTATASQSVDLVARIPGYLQSVNFADGAFVESNQLLFVIEPAPYEQQLKIAQAQLLQGIQTI